METVHPETIDDPLESQVINGKQYNLNTHTHAGGINKHSPAIVFSVVAPCTSAVSLFNTGDTYYCPTRLN